jgi:beta-glucuronidase
VNRLFEENKKRKIIPLDGIWKFSSDPLNEGIKKGWATKPPKNALETPVPSLWTCTHGYYQYEGAAMYFREFEAEGFCALVFHGVTGFADVYVDGSLKGSHYGGFTGFEVLLTGLKKGKHLLALRVDNTHNSKDAIPLAKVDWYHHGGIPRGVELHRHEEARISRFLIRYELTQTAKGAGAVKLKFELLLKNTSSKSVKRTVRIFMAGKKISEGPVEIKKETTAVFSSVINKVKLWSPSSPNLYRFDAEIEDDGLAEMTGFREIKTKAGRILLNGEEVQIKGVNRHEEHPDFGWALPLSVQYKDMSIIKEAGCNAIRGSHYPNAQTFLDLCDREGILFWEEIPMWGFPEEALKEKLVHERGLAMHEEMVYRDLNHPCIIFWGLHNEIDTRTQAGLDISKKFACLIRRLDESRPLTYATMFPMDDICFSLAGVISVNKYFGWYSRDKKEWEQFLKDFYAKLVREGQDKKPVIISEFGAGGVPGVRNFENQRWSEDYQNEYLDYTLKLFLSDKRLAGTFIWQYCDIRVCEEHIMGRPRGFNNKGIVDEYRRPKTAYKTVKERYGKKKTEK